MAFADLLKQDLDGILAAGHFEESITYHHVDDTDQAVERPMKAIIEGGTPEDEILIGISARQGPSPIIVHLSKTDVPVVVARRDRLAWRGELYGVAEIRGEDSAGWRLYCVR